MNLKNMGSLTYRALGVIAVGMGCLSMACGGGAGGGTALPDGPKPKEFYGSRINADDLANIVVGWNPANDVCNRTASYRLRAEHGGRLTSIRPFFIWSTERPGYQAGDGGHILIQIQTDDGTSSHFPSGTTLAALVYDHPASPANMSAGNHWPLLTFASPASLTAGELYHVVFQNVDPEPQKNWVSLDCLWMWDACDPEQPTIADTDMAVLERDPGGAWTVYKRGEGHSITPCIELDFEDGAAQGQGYLQGYGAPASSSWVNPKPISGDQGVRETFTVAGSDRVVSSVSVRANRLSGSSPLAIRIEQSDGTVLEQGTVAVAQGSVGPTHNGSSWARLRFAKPLTLRAGVGYHLVLSSPADTLHTAHALFEGSAQGYKAATYFADGHAEFNSGTGWRGWDLWGTPQRRDTDLQFYFESLP